MTRSKRYTRLGLIAVVAVLALAAVGSGGAAAVDRQTDTLDDYSNATVEWEDGLGGPPVVNSTGEIQVSTADSDISPSNVTIIRQSDDYNPPATIGDGDLDGTQDRITSGLDDSEEGTYDIVVDGALQATVTVDTDVDPHVRETDPINHSTIEDADAINISVDISEINETTPLIQSGVSDPNESLTTYRLIESDTNSSYDSQISITEINASDDDGVVVYNLSSDSGAMVGDPPVRYDYSGSLDDQSTLVVDAAVEEIEISDSSQNETTTLLTDDPLGGGSGGESSDNQTMILVAIGLLAAAFVFTRD